ncbi:MAG: hypothetical protein HY928_09300 [Elusimicrobia bacterium]|nr:hypothetical protein [Elusimicrobiota bacterium]
MLASTLLALAVSVSASAAPLPACVTKTKLGFNEPPTLKALMGCQAGKRTGFKGNAEALGDFQRGEVREYLARHPERASTDEAADGTAEDDSKVGKQKRRSREAAAANAERLPEKDRAEFQGLNEELWNMSGDGQLGVTSDMAKTIVGYLTKQQGGVSAEMADLLGSLEKDGAKLSHASMRKLKKAARDAKGEGLDLGIEDPSTEQWMLDPTTDPAPGEKDPSPAVN